MSEFIAPAGAGVFVTPDTTTDQAKASFFLDAVTAIFKLIDLGAGAIPNPTALTRGTHAVLSFDPDILQGISWQFFMPADYSGGDFRVTTWWATSGANLGQVVLGIAIERDNEGYDLDVDGFAAVNIFSSTPFAANGILTETIITLTNAQADGIQAGEPLRLFFQRNGASVDDTLTDTLLLVRITVKEF